MKNIKYIWFVQNKLYDQWSKTLKYTVSVSMQEINIFEMNV